MHHKVRGLTGLKRVKQIWCMPIRSNWCHVSAHCLGICMICMWFKDQELLCLAACKKAVWDKWTANGHPQEGPLYDKKITCWIKFSSSVQKLLREVMFKRLINNRFRASKFTGLTLHVNGRITSDPSTILDVWVCHFKGISAWSTRSWTADGTSP